MTPTTASHRTGRRAAAATAALLALGLGACGNDTTSSTSAAAMPSSSTTTQPQRPRATLDELVSVDGGRMHVRCTGQGDTTVVLIAGWDRGAETWSGVEPTISERARVCSYDRFGTGSSDTPATTQTFESQAADLHGLLDEIGESGPYVVVGHSFGGAEAVTFASAYADEVVGLMLVDASPTGWPDTVCSVPAYAGGCAVMRDPMKDAERLDVFPAFEAVATITSLGDLPMTVVTAAHRSADGLTPDELTRLDTIWGQGTERWAKLSTASSIVTVEDTGHEIQHDQPEVVVAEVLKLLDATSRG